MLKCKKYAVTQIHCENKDGKLNFYENWWASQYNTLAEAKNSLAEEVDAIGDFNDEDDNLADFSYENGKMIYLELWAVMCYKEHRDEEYDVNDGDNENIKCHYCLVPNNCPKWVMDAIRKNNNCPVVKYTK